MLTDLILQESLVWLLHILWKVSIEHERWYLGVWKLCAILDLDVLTLD